MKQIFISALVVVLLGCTIGFSILGYHDSQIADTPTVSSPSAVSASAVSSSAIGGYNSLLPEDLNSILDGSTTVPVDTIPNSLTVLANRNYLLPANYAPTDLAEPDIRFSFSYKGDKRKLRKEAADAIEQLFRAAEKKKVILYAVSGYRSYTRQKQIYDRNVSTRGKTATDKVSAMPGSSEHQTGLTMDISANSVGCQLSQYFGSTREGKWVAKNAHKYGYIIRYPEGKSKITGYHYEPWHIRYVGKTLATYLYKNKLTLEEFYGVSCNKEEKDTGVDVEEPDKVKYKDKKKKRSK